MNFDGSSCPICHGKKSLPRKSIGVGIAGIVIIGLVGFLFVNGYFGINEKNINESIQSISENIQETSKTAKDIETETSDKIQETVTDQIETIQKTPEIIPVKDISEIPKKIQESNPLNKKPLIDKKELERQVHLLVNQYRTQNGLDELVWDDKLSSIAKNHSHDMATRNYFEHVSPEGLDPTGRGSLQGYTCEKRVGNLIYQGKTDNRIIGGKHAIIK